MSPRDVFVAVLLSSALGFGGFGSLPFLRQYLAAAGLAADAILLQALTVGRLSPGPNGLFLIAVGYFVAGLEGVIVAVAAVVIPPLAILPISQLRERFEHVLRFRSALRSLGLAVVALLASTTVSVVSQAISSPLVGLLVGASAVLLLSRVPPWLLLIASAVVGAFGGFGV